MNEWFRYIGDWLTSDDREVRPVSHYGQFGTTVILEHRLVLGALAPLTASTSTSATNALSPIGSSSADMFGTIDSSSQILLSPTDLRQTSLSTNLASNEVQSAANFQVASVSDQLTPNDAPSSSVIGLDPPPEDLIASTTSSNAPAPSTSTKTTATSGNTSPSTNGTTPTANDTAAPSSSISDKTTATNLSLSSMEAKLVSVNSQVMMTKEQVDAGLNGSVDTNSVAGAQSIVPDWFSPGTTTTTIKYDFRDNEGAANEITDEQIQRTEKVLAAWSTATGGRIQWTRDTQSDVSQIVNISVDSLAGIGTSNSDLVGISRHRIETSTDGQTVVGTIQLNDSVDWVTSSSSSTDDQSVDFSTVMAHETGHMLGLDDDPNSAGVMNPQYARAIDLDTLASSLLNPQYYTTADLDSDGFIVDDMIMSYPQLSQTDVTALLQRASAATASNDAIIAIVDRNGTILGVRAEQDVLNTITDPSTLAFAVDGAISKARTAAFFANDTAPLTSRTVRNLSQTTILQREVESNPNADPVTDSTELGPGFVAPVGIGGHFPADVMHTPPVDLFAIEHTNRDSTTQGSGRFNIDPAYVPAGNDLVAPITYGTDAGIPNDAQNRGIATLPGGIPIYRMTDGGPVLIGGIGVFFPGTDGYATHEQGFVANQGQTSQQRTNSDRTLEAEYIAYAALGGSTLAGFAGVDNARIGALGGVDPVQGIDLPFGSITLVGISLELFGSTPGTKGLEDLLDQFRSSSQNATESGSDLLLGGGVTSRDGASVPYGYLVTPHASVDGGLTTDDMTQIIDAGIAAADKTRAAIRLDANLQTGATGVRMTFAITDTHGEVLALYRMEDGTVFSIDVAVAKARNVAYYADKAQLKPEDQVSTTTNGASLVDAGTAFSSRTFRFLAEPRFPSGVDGSTPPQFSILNDATAANVNPATGENIGTPADASAFTSVMGHDAFNPGTNFHDTSDKQYQNGIVFFPGSTPLYKDGVLVGGLGVSGDGVDQDDIVTFLAAQGFLPDGISVKTADQVIVNDARLPFQKFNRNPFA